MFHQIIVPLDGSEAAAVAIGPAAAMAQRLAAPIHILALCGSESERAALEATILEQVGSTGDIVRVIDVAPVERSVAEDITRLAARHAPSLVVMSTHGRGRSAGVLGSVANDILAATDQPVMLVGPTLIPGRFRTHGQALVAVTGDGDREVLDLTVSLLAETDFEPVVAHVVAPAAARQLDAAHLGPTGSDFPMDSVVAERAAHELEQSTDRSAIDFDVYHDKQPAKTITEQAIARRASLVVMATHARHGLDRLSHGSVTADVAREAPCPVLVVGLTE